MKLSIAILALTTIVATNVQARGLSNVHRLRYDEETIGSVSTDGSLDYAVIAGSAKGGKSKSSKSLTVEDRLAALEDKVAILETYEKCFEVIEIDGNPNADWIFSVKPGCDLLLNGGNLHLNYETEANPGNHVSGHGNIIMGTGHNVTSSGSIVSGMGHTVEGLDAVAIGGAKNTVTGERAVALGGGYSVSDYGSPVPWKVTVGNTVAGPGAVAIGGEKNMATGTSAVTLAGYRNEARGIHTSVTGGARNLVQEGYGGSISGGINNVARGDHSSILGGGSTRREHGNRAIGYASTIAGGSNNEAGALVGSTMLGPATSVGGGYGNQAKGTYSAISGGNDNVANGEYTSISGGKNNTAGSCLQLLGGSEDCTGKGDWSSVLGGKSQVIATDYGFFPGE